MEWSDYVARLMGSLDQTEAAEIGDVSQSNISRWLSGTSPDVKNAVKFARNMPGGDPLQALVILGVLDPAEMDKVVEVGGRIDEASNAELIDLLARRLGVNLRRRGA